MAKDKSLFLLFLGLVISCVGFTWAFRRGSELLDGSLHFMAFRPTPLSVNLPLLVIGAVSVIAIAITLIAAAIRFPSAAGVTSAILAGPITLAITAMITAVHPGLPPFVDRERVWSDTGGEAERLYAIPIFFQHADASLEPYEKIHIKRLIALFKDCGTDALRVRGFSSSAEFHQDSDIRNRLLANARARVVAAFLESELKRPLVVVAEWELYSDMIAARRIVDVDLNGGRLREIESLNRRAELTWSADRCLGR